MKQVYKFDENGKFIEPVVISKDEVVPINCTEKELPQPNWKPVFNGTDWVETITQAELDALQNLPVELTPVEQLQKDQADLTFQLMMAGVL